MKKFVLIMLIFLWPFSVGAVGASSYIVMDQDSKRVLEGSNINKESLIASISKIMTCIVALEQGNFDKTVKIDDSILKAYGSGIYIEVGEELTLDDLLYGLMLRSGNDAALAIAKAVAGDVKSFVFLMNEQAKKIGMENTSFVNPSGLEENDGTANKSTTYDMALLMRYAMQNNYFRKIVATKDIVVKSSYKTYSWHNKNKLLSMYEYCTGGKTGFTKKAHRTLVTTATKDNKNLIVVTFNDGNDFVDHRNLYEKNFNLYKRKKILDKSKKYNKNYYVKDDYYLLVKDSDKVETKIKDNTIEVYVNDNLINKVTLFFKRDTSLVFRLKEFIEWWEKI